MLRRLLVVGFVLSLAAAAPLHAQQALRAALPPSAPTTALSQHVIVISIDGLRADAIEAAGASTMTWLMSSGSATLEAQTVQPSRTLPSHTSMLTGVTPETHGITWNSDRTDELGTVAVPTVFDLAHDAGYRTAAFFSKSKFNHLVHDGSLDAVRVPGAGVVPASRIVREAVQYLKHKKPNLLFVHIAEPDFMGHRVGWMTPPYLWAVREADAGVGALLEAAESTYGEGNFTVIVTADHGGHGHDHGTDHPDDTTIPWISWGKGIRAAHDIVGAVRTMDTAATILQVLGVAVPVEWVGLPVGEALTTPLRAVAVDGGG